MNRRNFLKQSAVGGVIASAWPALAQTATQPAPPPPDLTFTTAPSLQNPDATGVTVTIGVNAPSTAWVEYGETEALGRMAYGARHGLRPFDSVVHQIRLEGLKPGGRCFYKVHACPIYFRNAYDIKRGTPIATATFSFCPLNPAADKASFAVWNDTHENVETLAKLMPLTAGESSDFHVWNGDVTNDNYHDDRMAVNYIGAGGHPFTRDTPLIFVRGNHDTRGPRGRELPRFQETPDNRSYYSFSHGPLGCVVLDTGEDKPDSSPVYAGLGDFAAYYEQQAEWLEAELKKPHLRKAKFRVAFLHIPLWFDSEKFKGVAADPNDPRHRWHQLLASAKFSAVISGHTHRHALLLPSKDRPYIQLVGGGPRPEAATLIRGKVAARELTLKMTDLQGRELAAWTTKG